MMVGSPAALTLRIEITGGSAFVVTVMSFAKAELS
jgi:hypothetical protein